MRRFLLDAGEEMVGLLGVVASLLDSERSRLIGDLDEEALDLDVASLEYWNRDSLERKAVVLGVVSTSSSTWLFWSSPRL